jgi:hypothetical protein
VTDPSNSTFACPQCGKRWVWKPEYSAKRVKCSCGSVFVAPSNPDAVEDDLYDMVTEPQTSQPTRAGAVSVTPGHEAAKPVIAYRSAPTKTVARPGRVELDDPWEGDKFRNLYVPIALLLAASLINVLVNAYFLKNASIGIRSATIKMGITLLIDIPVMLLACLLAVKLLDAAFGPLMPAILKLSSIALAPDALMLMIALAGFWMGNAGGIASMLIGGLLGLVIGWALSLALYFWLFTYYFDMTMGEAYRLIILIWVIRTFGVVLLRHGLAI